MTGRGVREVRARGRAGKVKFLPTSDAERREMLAAIGVSSIDDLFATVPAAVRQAPDLPTRCRRSRSAASSAGSPRSNANARDTAFFLGGGVYNHYVSAIADQMLYRAEWLTAYTPYQPEVSQGTLQSIFEFQTHICLLTGLEVANASLYEGASRARRGAPDGRAARRRGRSARCCRPASTPSTARRCGATSRTWASRSSRSPWAPTERPTRGPSRRPSTRRRSPSPCSRPTSTASSRTGTSARRRRRQAGALSVAVVAEAASLALLAPPGEGGADIACGEAQSLGVPMHNGGPLLGFLACRTEHQRQIPGPSRRPDAGRRGPARLLPDALDARAAHPAREGDLQHLHEPGADGARLEHPHVAARQEGPARGRRCRATRRPST